MTTTVIALVAIAAVAVVVAVRGALMWTDVLLLAGLTLLVWLGWELCR